jgi:hypothetical protein
MTPAASCVQLCSRGDAGRSSLWACTTDCKIAVTPLAAPGQLQGVTVVEGAPMVHGQSSISQVEEILVAVAQASVLLSGDILGKIGV